MLIAVIGSGIQLAAEVRQTAYQVLRTIIIVRRWNDLSAAL